MALRISLILAILAGLGVIGVSQFMLRPHIQGIIEVRDDNKRKWDDAEGRYRKTRAELGETKTKLESTEKNLEETKTQLVATTAKAESEEKRANGLQQNLDSSRRDLKVARDENEAWRGTGLKVEQVKELIASEKKLRNDKEVLIGENTMLVKTVKQKDAELDRFRGTVEDPFVPREVRGKVIVVDPKWDFVVLDVGTGKGVPDKGVLLVSRNGELVAKVRVMSVQEQRSIANIMPGWKLKDIMEGDAVLPY
jgi:hypothetical protein